jgi:hypothetical protein
MRKERENDVLVGKDDGATEISPLKRFVVTLGDGSEYSTQGFVNVTLCLRSHLEFSVRLHLIEASSFDVNLEDGCLC